MDSRLCTGGCGDKWIYGWINERWINGMNRQRDEWMADFEWLVGSMDVRMEGWKNG